SPRNAARCSPRLKSASYMGPFGNESKPGQRRSIPPPERRPKLYVGHPACPSNLTKATWNCKQFDLTQGRGAGALYCCKNFRIRVPALTVEKSNFRRGFSCGCTPKTSKT